MRIVAIGGVVKSQGHDKSNVIKDALAWQGATPHVLIVPSAASTETSYDKNVGLNAAFFGRLGVSHSVLHKFDKRPTPTQVDHEVGRAGLIYVLGGNSPHLLRLLAEHGSGNAIKHAVQRKDGATLAGTSAGAILSGRYMHSNPAAKPAEVEWGFTYLDGLGLLHAALTAHANKHDPTPTGSRSDSRLENLKATLPADVSKAIGIDNGAALMINDGFSYVDRLSPSSRGDVHIATRNLGGYVISQPASHDPYQLSRTMNSLKRY